MRAAKIVAFVIVVVVLVAAAMPVSGGDTTFVSPIMSPIPAPPSPIYLPFIANG